MKEFRLRDGQKCFIEEARPEDAPEIIDYLNQVAGESDNLTFGPGDLKIRFQDERAFIKRQAQSETSTFLVARVGGKIVGNINLQGNTKKRLRHLANFGITVLQEYWGLGIGRVLLEEMISYAKDQGISKINLKVRSDNQRAIGLYKRLGFQEEGLEKRGMFIDNEYVDFLLMGLILK